MNFNVLNYKIRKRYFKLFSEKIYSSYEDALAHCSKKGYENDIITQLIKTKAVKFRENFKDSSDVHFPNNNILAVLAAINSLKEKNKPINVIDFGGGDGKIYFLLKRCIAENIKINWYVVETSAMVNTFKELETANLFFRDDLSKLLETLDEVDILHTACAFQYTPDPIGFLKTMSYSKATYKIFNRQSLNAASQDLWTIQRSLLSWHGSKDTKTDFKDCEFKYPHLNMSIGTFEKIIRECNNILYTFEDNTGIKKVNKEKIIGKSYVVKIKN